MTEIQLITEIWKHSQTNDRYATINQFKGFFSEDIKEILLRRSFTKSEREKILDNLRNEIVQIFNIPLNKFTSNSRKTIYVIPRHIFCKVAIDMRIASLVMIKTFVRRDHTTVINSRRMAENMLETSDPKFMKYWHIFLEKASPQFSHNYCILIKADVQEKHVAKYSNTTPYGIAFQ